MGKKKKKKHYIEAEKEEKREEKTIEFEIKKPEIIVLSLVLLFFLFLELRVTISNHIAFGDEGFHGSMARYIGVNKDFPKWVPMSKTDTGGTGYSDNPLWHLLVASFFMFLGFKEIIIKFLPPFIGTVLLGFATYILTKKLFNKEIAFIAAVITVSVPSLVTYSVLNYKDSLLTLYFTIFSLSLILALKLKEQKYWIISGVMGGLIVLTKTSGMPLVPVVSLSFFLYRLYETKNIIKTIKEFLPLVILVALISSTFFLRNLVFYKTPTCASFLPIFDTSGCGYSVFKYKHQYEYEGRTVEVGTEVNPIKMGLMNYFNFAYGFTLFLPLTFILGFFLLLNRRKNEDILLLLILASFIPIFYIAFGARAEDTIRWLMPLVPTITIISASYLNEIYIFIRKYFKVFALVVFLLVLLLSYININQKVLTMNQVKKFSPAFFEACDWSKKNLPENIRFGAVVWGYATTYNCERQYGGGGPDVIFSQNLTLMLSLLKIQNVSHLFIQKFSIAWNDAKLTERYPISYVRFLENNPKQFVKLFENGPPLDKCMQMGGCDGSIIYEINYTGVKLIPPEELTKSK